MHALVERLRRAHGRARLVAFLRALVLPFRVARFLAGQRGLWSLAAAPALISVSLFVIAAGLVVAHADAAVSLLWTPPVAGGVGTELLRGLWHVLYAVALLFGLMVAYVVTLLVSSVVASPFNDALSARVERLLTGREAPSSEGTFLGEAVQSIVSTAAIALLYVALMAPVLALNLVPGLGSLAATVLGTGLGAFFLALEFTDIALSRRGYTLREKIRLLRAHPALTAGFGLSTAFLLWIPLLNVLCVPIAVVGGTAMALALAEHEE